MKGRREIQRMISSMADDEPLTHEDYEMRGYRQALMWVLETQDQKEVN